MLPIIVAGSRPAVAGLAQSQHFDCDTSADLHRLRRASITETARSRVSFASTVLLNPIGSYRLPHPHQPNRHRARRTASRIPSRDFLLWRFANAGPQAAEFAATSVTGRHPKTFTQPDSRIAANSISIRSPRLRAVSSDDGTFIRPRICSVHTQSLNHDQASVEIEFPNGLSHTVSASEHTLTCGRSLD